MMNHSSSARVAQAVASAQMPCNTRWPNCGSSTRQVPFARKKARDTARVRPTAATVWSKLRLQRVNELSRWSTRRTRLVPHPRDASGHEDFCIAHSRRVVAVHAERIRTDIRRVRAMQPTKPLQVSRRPVLQGILEGATAGFLRTRFVEARRDPNVCSPSVTQKIKAFYVPAPLNELLTRRKDAEELVEWRWNVKRLDLLSHRW